MMAPDDKKTADLLPNFDLAGEVPAKPTAKEMNAARVRKYREAHGVRSVTISLPKVLADELDAWLAARGKTKSEVLAKLIKTQLLRPR